MSKTRKRISIVISIVLLISIFSFTPQCSEAMSVFTNFITRDSVTLDRLLDGNSEFRFLSIETPDIHQHENQVAENKYDRFPDEFEIRDALNTVLQMGGSATRTMCLSFQRSGEAIPVYVTGIRTYNETAFRALDKVLDVANQLGVRVIIPFIDGHDFGGWGGVTQMCQWRGKTTSDFWTDATLRQDFENLMYDVVNRTNYYTGQKYKDDKAILAWQLGNELNTYNCNPQWEDDMAVYLKSIDGNHLVMAGEKSASNFSDLVNYTPHIDIVGAHYYQYWAPEGTDLVAWCNSDKDITRGKKVFIVDEFGMGPTSVLTNLMDAIINNGTSGGILWGLRGHRREGGFRFASEADGTGSYHWPGFPTGNSYNETDLLDILRNKAYAIRGPSVPSKPIPAAPVLLNTCNVSSISWQGSVGAEKYDVERAASPDGPWSVIGTDVRDDILGGYWPLFSDTSAAGGQQYYYRVKAKNVSGTSDPSNVIGPVWAGSSNAVSNPGFEDGTGPWALASTGHWATVTDGVYAHSGTSYLKLNGTGDWCATCQNVSVKPNTDYTLSFYAKVPANVLYMKLLTTSNAVIKTWGYMSVSSFNAYTKYALTFNSGSNSTVKLYFGDGGTGICYIDDVSVRANTLVTDEMADFTKMYSHTANLGFDGSNPNYFGGDIMRLTRTSGADPYQNIVYNTTGDMQSVTVSTYFWPSEPVADFKFYTSPDNVTYTELTATKTVNGGNWDNIVYTSPSIPTGTRYLKIEFRNTSAFYWTPQISSVQIGYQASLVDEMNDFSKMYSHTDHVAIQTLTPGYFNGDTSGCYADNSTGYQNIVYNTPSDMQDFMVNTYFWPYEPKVDFKFYTSPDGSDNSYTEFMPNIQNNGGDWINIVYTSSSIPSGTRYLKIEFRNTSINTWTPTIGRLQINYGATLTDGMNDFTKMYSHTGNLGFDSYGTSPSYFGADTSSRLKRTAGTDPYQNIVYNTTGDMLQFMVSTYFWPGELVKNFKFYTSPDGVTYTDLTADTKDLSGDWDNIVYTSSSIPSGTRYLKIEFRNNSDNYWTPQISRLQLVYNNN